MIEIRNHHADGSKLCDCSLAMRSLCRYDVAQTFDRASESVEDTRAAINAALAAYELLNKRIRRADGSKGAGHQLCVPEEWGRLVGRADKAAADAARKSRAKKVERFRELFALKILTDEESAELDRLNAELNA